MIHKPLSLFSLLLSSILLVSCSTQREAERLPGRPMGDSSPLTVVAIGDAGDPGSALRANASYIDAMFTGRHDGGIFHALIFLGNNFSSTGLNVPAHEVDTKVKSVLGSFTAVVEGIGRANVHGIPGNDDWYARNAIERSILFGLIKIDEGPMGLSEKGNLRASALEQWTYHYRMPGQAFYAVGGGTQDSVQFVFFDSALLLRTATPTWRAALDSLCRILADSKSRPGVKWRILCVHHPFHTLGEHAGYTEWDDESASVTYLSPCDRDSNASGYIRNWLDPQDLCAEKYRQYVDSVKATIRASGVTVQVVLSGHDHSLQLMFYPDRDAEYDGWPKVHVVSGAGSRFARVKLPSPPAEYTSALTAPEKEGASVPGFAQLRFLGDKLRIVFFNANNGEKIDMGGGKKEFWIDAKGVLLND